MEKVYFDNASTSWPKPDSVYVSMNKFIKLIGASPGRGTHRLSLEASRIIYSAREKVGELFNIKKSENIIFTNNATYASNLAIKGLLCPGDRVITTSMEHNAVMRPLRYLEKKYGVVIDTVKCGPDGLFAPDDIHRLVRKNTKLITVIHVSNVTGTVMPVKETGMIAREYGIAYMVDAAQSAGIIPVDVESMNIDLLVFTGHKDLFGPPGTGGLYIREGIKIEPLVTGGTGNDSGREQQPEFLPDKFESGTLNTPGIAGFKTGVEFILNVGIENISGHCLNLTEKLIAGLEDIKSIKIYGSNDFNLRTAVVSFAHNTVDSKEISHRLDRDFNIMTRAGFHCAPAAHKTIGTFEGGTVRLSLSYFNTEEEVDYVIKSIKEVLNGSR